jgi:hypothetical protein
MSVFQVSNSSIRGAAQPNAVEELSCSLASSSKTTRTSPLPISKSTDLFERAGPRRRATNTTRIRRSLRRIRDTRHSCMMLGISARPQPISHQPPRSHRRLWSGCCFPSAGSRSADGDGGCDLWIKAFMRGHECVERRALEMSAVDKMGKWSSNVERRGERAPKEP